jgi:hypothetical protein
MIACRLHGRIRDQHREQLHDVGSILVELVGGAIAQMTIFFDMPASPKGVIVDHRDVRERRSLWRAALRFYPEKC